MNGNRLHEKIENLERKFLQLQKELRSYMDYPQSELLPKFPSLVTSSDRLSFSVENGKLIVKQKNYTIGVLTLEKG